MSSRFDLYYGEPFSGKSRSLITLIKSIHEQSGLKARVYVGDGSAEMYRNSGLVAAGVVQLMQFDIRDSPFTICQQITEGWFAAEPLDPASKMVKPTPQQMMEIGIWIYEGCAVMGQYMMGDMKGGLAQRAADGEVIGQDAPIKFSDSKDYNFGANSPAHYGIGQRHLQADILRSKALPGTVVWTTHERMDDGERGGAFGKGGGTEKTKLNEKIIGPELIGKALTANISRDFGNTLHFVKASKKVADGTDPLSGKTNYSDKTEYRVYTEDHFDPDGIVALKYRAGVRAMDPSKIKPFYSSNEHPGQGLLELYRDLELSNKL